MKIKNIHHDKNIIIKNEKINNQSQSILGKTKTIV